MTRISLTTSDGVQLSCIDEGQGPPLLLIPGWSQSAEEFRLQTAFFGRTRRVLALDMRGHGLSQKVAHGYRIQRLAKDLHDVIRALGLERPDVLGHSMGCSVIWSHLSLFAGEQNLGKLVLVDQAPAVLAQPGWDEATRLNAGCLLPNAEALAGFEQAVVASETVEATKGVIRGMFTASVAETDLDWVAHQNLALPRIQAAELLHDHCVLDWRSQIQAVRQPVLVVGAEASIFSAASQRWIAAQVPSAQLEIFTAEQKGSHFMFFENPDRFNAIVAAFLAG